MDGPVRCTPPQQRCTAPGTSRALRGSSACPSCPYQRRAQDVVGVGGGNWNISAVAVPNGDAIARACGDGGQAPHSPSQRSLTTPGARARSKLTVLGEVNVVHENDHPREPSARQPEPRSPPPSD
eukprot:693996-Pleurochrysis_carterae.AAC.3